MTDLPVGMSPHFRTQTMTPEEAAKRLECPLARVMHKAGESGMCKGDACAAWRYLPLLASDPSVVSAIKRELLLIADEYEDAKGRRPSNDLLHKQAVERVMRDPSAYCIPSHHERGFCGLGGHPSA